MYEDVKDLVPVPDFTFADAFAGDERHNTLGGSFVKLCWAAEGLFRNNPFDIVIVQGDTTTAWALAQMAFNKGIRVAHVEAAGLRIFDLRNPYPEELNKTLIGRLAHLHFAPTRQAWGVSWASRSFLQSPGPVSRRPRQANHLTATAMRRIGLPITFGNMESSVWIA